MNNIQQQHTMRMDTPNVSFSQSDPILAFHCALSHTWMLAFSSWWKDNLISYGFNNFFFSF